MHGTLEFIGLLAGIAGAALLIGVAVTIQYRRAAQARRMRKHFSSKRTQPERPT